MKPEQPPDDDNLIPAAAVGSLSGFARRALSVGGSGNSLPAPPSNASKMPLDAIQRQKSLPAPLATTSPLRQRPPANFMHSSKPFIRMNSDPKMLPSSQEQLLDSLDEIDLLHKIAKTPNMLNDRGAAAAAAAGSRLAPPNSGPAGPASPQKSSRNKLVKQKSLNRTLSTSVLRIKKKRSFWSSA